MNHTAPALRTIKPCASWVSTSEPGLSAFGGGMEAKKCTGCGEAKALDEFPKRGKDDFRRRGRCKACISKYAKRTYPQRKETLAKYCHEYRKTHRDECRARQKRYYERHKERMLEKSRKKQRDHPEKNYANGRVRQAIKDGVITRPSACEKCGAIAQVVAHHEDYSKPLDVDWLCRPCHAYRHNIFGQFD